MRENMQKSFLIIGGGLVGLATAYRLLQRWPSVRVTLLEKEAQVGLHQSSHNSGVLHAGLYYLPGSLKARLAVTGIRQMRQFCHEQGINYEICGKLVVAATHEELPRLELLLKRGIANGLQNLRKLEGKAIGRIEPYVSGLAAIHVPEEGIVDYRQVCQRLLSCIQARGGNVVTAAKVIQLQYQSGVWLAKTATAEFTAAYIINCAGLQSDQVARLAGKRPEAKIIPFRGEYHQLKPSAQHLVKHLVYPVPNPQFPFLGVHFTRLIQGGIEAGPNAVLAFAREGYQLSTISPLDLYDMLAFPGLWRFLQKYPGVVGSELWQSCSKAYFCRALQRLVPDIRVGDLMPGGAGVRAQAMTANGELVTDFYILNDIQALHVLNAPSPAATASLAIGEYIVGCLPP
jgi:(S)-2-hydroxyglutarate dehydrogenase